MYKKKCSVCHTNKEFNQFTKDKSHNDGLRCSCKPCEFTRAKRRRRTIDGLISQMYSTQKESSKKRNHPQPNYTLSELSDWIKSNPNFLTIYKNWVDNDYFRELKPSCDRICNSKYYMLDNMKLMTWGENRKNAHIYRKKDKKICKAVVGVCKKTNNIIEFISTREAERCTNIAHSNISIGCKKKNKSFGGYIWYYKEDYINIINK